MKISFKILTVLSFLCYTVQLEYGGMKIAQIAPIIERVPPKKYGGTERVVYALTEELVKKGHDVTLFATADSITSAHLIPTAPESLRAIYKNKFYERNLKIQIHIGTAYQLQDEFDIIHDHCEINSLAIASTAKTPVIMTLHGSFNEKNLPVFKRLNNSLNPYFVSISNSQRIFAPQLNYISTVYNGLEMDHYPFSSTSDGYLLFVGRIAMEKGVHNAIEVAQQLNLPLIIAAKLEKINLPYFKKYVKPHLNDKIRWIGEVDEKERNILMSKALCFLHPITWWEPFGLTLIEAMATGCPVVAFNKGSIPEVVAHGKTGFVVKNVKQMIRSINSIHKIDRNYCREYALRNFNAHKMTNQYEQLYYKILAGKYRKHHTIIPRISKTFL